MATLALLKRRDKIKEEIIALENSLRADGTITDLSFDASSGDESVDSGPQVDKMKSDDLEAERQQIQREIEELENTLGANAELVGIVTESSEEESDFSNEDTDDIELDLPQNIETCLQINLVYQEVLKEKLAELEKLLSENQQQQKDIEDQLSGSTNCSSSSPGLPIQKLFLGYFMKPYFKDKLTALGPPANYETKERLSYGTRPVDELKIRRWEVWQKALLTNAVATDTMKRMLQPKLSKLDYLSGKMSKAKDEEKEEMKKQIDLIEQDIKKISAMSEEQLVGEHNDDHDWEKISNIDFEGLRNAEDLKRFWQNYLHPSINKTVWRQEEVDELRDIVQEKNCCHWDKIAEALGTKRTAFMCFQSYQRYISKTFRRKEWTKEEDQILIKLVKKMRIGNFIPYMQMSYFMVGRDASQLSYRWTSVLDPSIKKGPWSKEEDQLLRNAVTKYGTREWWKIRMEVPGRTDGACRDRYLDCLQENVKKGAWSTEEVELLKQKVEKYGVGKWTKIASEIPNRIDCQCLNKWKQLTNQSHSTKRKLNAVQQKKTKKQKVIEKQIKTEVEITSSSEDEKQLNVEYMDSDAEPDVPLDTHLVQERPVIDYVQPDIKEWIPLNKKPMSFNIGTVRTIWLSLSMNGVDIKDPNKLSTSGCHRAKNSLCSPVEPSPVRNTVLDHFGNVERIYVGIDATALQNLADNENTLIKVPVNDVKNLQWKETSVNKKDKRKCTEHKRKRRHVRDWSSLNSELLKAISPWIGNVIMPAPAIKKKYCEADIIGIKAAEIPLLKTPVFSFFIKALHIDAEGCKNVIKVLQNKRPRIRGSDSKPKTVLPNTVLATLQERKCMKIKTNKPREDLPQLLPCIYPNELTTSALMRPNYLVITQPNMQEAKKPLMINTQKLSLLPESPPQANLLPLIQLTAPEQPVTALTTTSLNRVTQRDCKATKKVLIEEANAEVKKSQKQNRDNQNAGVPREVSKLQTQACNWIFSPTKLVLSANFPGNQMMNVPKDSPINASTLTNTTHMITDKLMPSSSININSVGIQSPTSKTLVENKAMQSNALQMTPHASVILHQNHQSSFLSTFSSVSPAVTSVFSAVPYVPSDSSLPNLLSGPGISKPPDRALVSKPQAEVFRNVCVPVTSTQPPHFISQSFVHQVRIPSEPFLPSPNLSSDTLSFNSDLFFSGHKCQINDWINGNGAISLPHLETTFPYLPPSAASIKKMTFLLKNKQLLVRAAGKILTDEYQNDRREKEKVDAIRKLVVERFAANPAYLLLKARFMSCFTFPAILATINPFKDCEIPDPPLCDDNEVVDKHAGENVEPPVGVTC